MIPTPFRKAARTIGAVGIGLAVVAGSALAQFAPANNGTLSTRMRWVQFEIVGGRIVASSVHVGANMNSSTNANGRVEKIQIDLTGTAPDIHYELLDKADTVRLDVNDGDDFALRSQSGDEDRGEASRTASRALAAKAWCVRRPPDAGEPVQARHGMESR